MTFSNANAKAFYKYLCDFSVSHNKIYIYGGGVYGKQCFNFLQKKKIHVDGFITTDGGDALLGLPMYKAKEILMNLDSDSGVILAVKKEYQKQILEEFSFPCSILRISAADRVYLQVYFYFGRILEIDREKYPFKAELNCNEWKNILVVQLEATYGDMIWSTAFYRELRSAFPDSHIMLIMNSKYVSLYRNCPYVDEIVPYECNSILQEITIEMEERVKDFLKKNFEGIIFDALFLPRLLPMSYADACENILFAMFSGAKNRIAHAMYVNDHQKYMCDVIADLFTVVAKHTEAKHEVLHDLDMLTACGYEYGHNNMELWIDDKDEAYASSLFKDIPEGDILIAIAMVGSSGTRSWSPYKYGNVFYEISKRSHNKIKFLLCGGTDASKAAFEIPDEQKTNCIDITGKTSLTEAAAVISKCDIYLGSDTGLMHMAASFGIPIIEISASNMETPDCWGSSPRRTGPWGVDSIVLRPEKGLEECKYFCTRPYAHCINQVTEEQVANALEKMIGKLNRQL